MNADSVLLGDHWVSKVTLVLSCACLYAGFKLVSNELLVPWLEFDRYRFLVYLPAGMKLVLIMVFGWLGTVGVALGVAAAALNEFQELHFVEGLAYGAASAASTMIGVKVGALLLRIEYPWTNLRAWSLVGLAVMVGALDALTVHASMVVLQLDTLDGDVAMDLIKAAFGRITGALLFIGVVVDFRRRLRLHVS